MDFMKNSKVGKYVLLEEPFSIKGRKYCKVKCSWCGKVFTTQLRSIKKGIGCACEEKTRIKVGQVFGELKVIELVDNKTVLCQCSCGSIKTYRKGNLNSGNTTNCGCIKAKKLIARSTKHNLSKTRIYGLYLSMKDRCYNSNCYAYKWYGLNGIKVCDEWRNNFVAFYDWAMANGYKDNLSIERIDVNKDYEPSNCCWIPFKKQHENTRNAIRIKTKNGFTFVKDIAFKYKIPKSTLYSTIRKIDKKDLTEENIINKIKRSNKYG